MEFRQLKTFIAIAQTGSFTKAADQLGYAQSSVTTQIQLLEEEMGVRLFERLGKNISLTPAGEKFLVYAEQILKLAREAKDVVSSSEMVKGVLVIGAIESLCSTRLPDLYEAFHKLHPHVEVNIKIGENQTELKRYLRENLIDLALLIECGHVETEGLLTEVEIHEQMVLLVSPENKLTDKEAVYPRDLEGETLVLTETTCNYRKILESILHQSGVKPYSVIESGSIQALKKFTMSGMGISFLPQIAVEEELKEKKLKALNWKGPDFGLNTRLIRHKDKWISPVLQAFLDLSKKMLK